MRRVPLSILAALPPVLLLLVAPTGASALSYSPCSASGGFSCASLPVPLDRSGAVPGTVSLSIERKLGAGSASPDAVVALAGGPGQAMLPLAPYIAEVVSPALSGSSTHHDLLLFDQRGTGSSGPLVCPALSSQREISQAHSGAELVERCARQLGPARGAYTTRESVEDIEAVRQAAGYEKLVLYGTSYGTKVALEYAARYPQHVESLVLDSTETPEGPEPFHVSTFKAMGPVLRELCSHRACDGVSSNPVRDLARLVGEMSARPLTGRVFDGRGKRTAVTVTSRELFYLLLAGDLNPAIRPQLPAAVHAALNHDPDPLARLVTLVGVHPSSEPSSDIDFTLFVDTSCEETPFPWQRSAPEATRAVEAEAALNSLPSSDFYPFDPESGLFDQTIPLCVSWPDASAAPPAAGSLPNVPALILSGGQDLRTPTEDARRVASLIPDAQLVQVPYAGHSVIGSDLSGCAKAAVASFFAGTALRGCDAAVNHFRLAPVPPKALTSVTSMAGLGAPQGRTVAGVVDSLLDLRRAVLTVGFDFGGIPYGARFGGLHGGTASVTRAGVVLDRFSYVPGLQLTGLVANGIVLKNAGATATLTVRGSQAATGRIRVASGGRISGTLAGRSFHVSAAAKVKLARAGQGSEAASEPAFPVRQLARLR
ncbi:MAG TPA: alpha/beta fold hydrolase [Solirubrobacteraceae bacterium]|jgi:pimeloyl-ACP methyl ester carboxylesterase|nr:alpha/beta fold hydrolase [Solirubrobacteraceae bacterium]